MMKSQLYITICFLVLSSCGTQPLAPQNLDDSLGAVLKLNFNENIRTSLPNEAVTTSEKFIRSLLYDKLLESVSSADYQSKLIRHISFDSTHYSYSFELQKDIMFNEVVSFDTSDVRFLFEYLLSKKSNDTQVQWFFEAIKGYNSSLNSTSLPSGIEFVNKYLFTIKLRKPMLHFLELLTSDHFYVQRDSLGTGDYYLTNLNDDISCSLKRKTDSRLLNNVVDVEMRFIKNKDEEISDFLNQRTDLITFNSSIHFSPLYQNQLTKIIDHKYPDFQVNKSNETLIKYAKIYNITDSASVLTLIKSMSIGKKSRRLFRSNFVLSGQLDSTITSIKDSENLRFNGIDEKSEERLSFLVSNEKFNQKKIDQNQPFYVLNETYITDFRGDEEKTLDEIYELENSNDGMKNQWILVFVGQNPTYYISHFEWKGIMDFQSASEIVKKTNFEKINSY